MRKSIFAAFFVFAAYLLQVCVVPYLKIADVAPNMLVAVIAIYVVVGGKLAAFCAGAVLGILMETMVSALPLIHVIMYPVLALLGGQFFADWSIKQRAVKYEAKKGPQMIPLLRTILCAALLSFLAEVVMVFYLVLSGAGLTIGHLLKALLAVLYTCVATLAFYLPIRKALLRNVKINKRTKTKLNV